MVTLPTRSAGSQGRSSPRQTVMRHTYFSLTSKVTVAKQAAPSVQFYVDLSSAGLTCLAEYCPRQAAVATATKARL
jgi:hypothetical protein